MIKILSCFLARHIYWKREENRRIKLKLYFFLGLVSSHWLVHVSFLVGPKTIFRQLSNICCGYYEQPMKRLESSCFLLAGVCVYYMSTMPLRKCLKDAKMVKLIFQIRIFVQIISTLHKSKTIFGRPMNINTYQYR